MDEPEKKSPEPKMPIRPNRISIRPAIKKSETSRVDLSTVKPPVAPGNPVTSTPLDERPTAPAMMPPTTPPPSPVVAKPAAPEVPEIVEGIRPPPSIFDKANLPGYADEMFGRSTMRIELPPEVDKKRETTRIELPAAAKKETAKIELPAAAAGKAKSTTMALGVPVAPPPGPAKPKRPGSLIMKRPGAPALPGESIVVEPAKTAQAAEQARKSETARIDLSAEQLDTADGKPKTIRIKRPDGSSGRKPLAVARPEGKKLTAATMGGAEMIEEEDADTPGMAAVLTAIAALLVCGFLFYMLLAQSIAPTLPFPGKI